MVSAPPTPPALPDVVEEHLEELGFLAIQRRKLIVDPDTTLQRLAEHAERVAAHREGLQIAGRVAADIAAKRLDDASLEWHVAAAGRIWIEEGTPSPQEVELRIEASGAPLVAGWREALRRTTPAQVERLFPRGAADPAGPCARQARADARVWHGRASEGELAKLAADGDPSIRASVARSLARSAASGSSAVRAALERLADDTEVDVRRRALWSLGLVDRAAALARARRSLGLSPPDAFALRVVGLLGDESDAPRLRKLAAHPAALRALGDLGRLDALDVLLEQLRAADAELVGAAADAILMLLGFPQGLPALFPADPEVARLRGEDLRGKLDVDARWLRGRPFPHDGVAALESTESRWRALVLGPPMPDAHRAEVPDGFFSGFPSEEALCGE